MSALLVSLLALLAPNPLRPESIARFDGREWAGIRLNVDTDSDIKRAFRTEKGAVRPEALKIVTDRPRDVRVDALLDGRGGKAVVRTIRVDWMYDPPTVAELEDAYDEHAVDHYLPGRNEDWKLVAFPFRGVLGFSFKGNMTAFFLTTPEGLRRALGDYQEKPTSIVPVPDPGAGWNRTVTFGDSSVLLFVGDNAPGEFDDSGRRRIREAAQYAIEGTRTRSLAYSRREKGAVSVTIRTGKFDDDGAADCTVALTLNTNTPYGGFERSISRSRKIRPRYRDSILNLMDDAIDALKDDVANASKRLSPPSPERTREDAMQKLYAGLS